MAFPEVIIATHVYNEQIRLPRLLDSLIVQDYPNLTVFISENHSKDNTPEILKSYSGKLSMKIVKPHKYLNQIENFFFMVSELLKYASVDAKIFYVGADDYFVQSNSIRQLIDKQIITGHEIILPRINLSSPGGSLRASKSYYSSNTSFFRLIQLFSDRTSLGVQVHHSLMSLGAFSYWTRQFSQWRSGINLDRDSFAEYMALWDLVSKYSMSYCKDSTFVKEINNRKDSSNRFRDEIIPKQKIDLPRIIRTHHSKNISTFRMIKRRARITEGNLYFFLLLAAFSYFRNWISDFKLFFQLLRLKLRARKNS